MLKRLEKPQLSDASSTVLVVDDTASARWIVSKTLDDLGFETLLASDGKRALSSVRDFHPDALVTDLEMPNMDGEHLIEALRSSPIPFCRDMPIIVCSSKTDAATIRELSRLGANAIVPKPVDVRVLAAAALRLFRDS